MPKPTSPTPPPRSSSPLSTGSTLAATPSSSWEATARVNAGRVASIHVARPSISINCRVASLLDNFLQELMTLPGASDLFPARHGVIKIEVTFKSEDGTAVATPSSDQPREQ